MTDHELILALAKVIIAAAWADGQVTDDEINNLKGLLLRLRESGASRGIELTAQDWARLDMYLEEPVEADERHRLVAELRGGLRSSEQKRLAMAALNDVVAADGEVTPEERAVLAEIEGELEEASLGVFGSLNRLFGGSSSQRAVMPAPNRELYFDDYLRNKVYYNLSRRLEDEELQLDLSDDEQRKLGLAGGLMAQIARVDDQLSTEEFQIMTRQIQEHWDLNDTAASFVVEVALSTITDAYDPTRMMQEMTQVMTPAEKQDFLKVLFAVAASDGKISVAEHEEIRLVSLGLNLSHEDFIAAKMAVLQE